MSESVAPAADEYFPVSQLEQADFSVAPTRLEYEPFSQLLHADAASVFENVPAPQLEQVVDPLVAKVPATHFEQDDAPPVENSPSKQLLHTELDAAPRVTEALDASQSSHPDMSVAPKPVEYLPRSQLVQVSPTKYVPALQSEQVPSGDIAIPKGLMK
jgi:hypothetical protein